MIEKELNLLGFYEPVDDNPYLQKFYENPKRWAFPMQIHLLHKRYVLQQHAAWTTITSNEWNGSIIDRGIPGDRVFAKIHHDNGNIHDLEWQTYQEMYEVMAHTLTPPSLMVYIDVSPEVAYKRARSRVRSEEAVVEDQEFMEYLTRLNKYYLDLIIEIQTGGHAWSTGIKVLKIDWNDDLNRDKIDNLIDLIRKYTNIESVTPVERQNNFSSLNNFFEE